MLFPSACARRLLERCAARLFGADYSAVVGLCNRLELCKATLYRGAVHVTVILRLSTDVSGGYWLSCSISADGGRSADQAVLELSEVSVRLLLGRRLEHSFSRIGDGLNVEYQRDNASRQSFHTGSERLRNNRQLRSLDKPAARLHIGNGIACAVKPLRQSLLVCVSYTRNRLVAEAQQILERSRLDSRLIERVLATNTLIGGT
jgi:hypothetical protein